MAFWSSEKLKETIKSSQLIFPADTENRVKHGAYELSLGNEYFTTGNGHRKKSYLPDGAQLSIEPGQFALLLTKEVITIPNSAISFISIKASIKFRGLINVSGFHVDPGFQGQLKFAVYNAGSRSINITSGDQIFLIWFADLCNETLDSYNGKNNTGITSNDVMNIDGDIASPAQLDLRLKRVEQYCRVAKYILLSVIVVIFTTFLAEYMYSSYINSTDNTKQPRQEIINKE